MWVFMGMDDEVLISGMVDNGRFYKAAFRPRARSAKRFGVRRDSAALGMEQMSTPI
jgi:hypothetical protein